MQQTNLFFNRRLLALLFLGFSSGLPLMLTNSTLQAWFTQAGISVVMVGALTLVGLPYTFKFLWAPLFDYYQWPKLGRRRGWILLMQLGVGIAFLVLAQCNPSRESTLMGGIALIAAFFSASQDIAVDAYRTDILPDKERGLGASYFVFAYRLAMLVGGGLSLVFADYLGWTLAYQIMAVLMFFSMIPAFFAPEPDEKKVTETNLWQIIQSALRDLLKQEKIILVLCFIALYKVGDAFALSLMMNFLLKGLGFSLTEVGFAYKFVSFLATVLGCLLGGVLLTRWNIYRGLLVFGIAQMVSNFCFVLLALIGKHFGYMVASIFIENFCSGLSTAALLAFLMSLCNRRYSATQYGLLSAITSLGRVFLGPFAGVFVLNYGWVQFYLFSCLLCLPSLFLLIFLKDRVSQYVPAEA